MILSPVAFAWIADFAFGDPQWKWHPVRLMGRLVSIADVRLPHTRLAGIFLALALPGVAMVSSSGLLWLAGDWVFPLEVLLVYFCVAGRDMLVHAGAVLKALEAGDLALARKRVALIVGRDTQKLNHKGVTRATIESVAESFCDGLLAPLFYAFLGGAPLALAYKAVSTLDSMVGYKNRKYADFGWASARLDDLLNFVPARLSALIIALVSRRPVYALKTAIQDGPKQPSPNSGWPEGAFAGALGLQLGGVVSYGGKISKKALLGKAERPIDLRAGRAALSLFMRASVLALISGELLWHWLKG